MSDIFVVIKITYELQGHLILVTFDLLQIYLQR